MQIISIPLARSLAFIETGQLNPQGKVSMQNLLRDLASLCQFVKSPTEAKDFESKDGLEFEHGFYDGLTIKKLVIFPQIIYADTLSSTDDSQRIIGSLLEWAKENHGIVFEASMIKRWAYVSDIVFSTDFPLLDKVNPVLRKAGKIIGDAVHKNLKEDLEFSTAEIKISHDPQRRSALLAPFSITHRLGSPYEENMFFSEAPVSTPTHIELLSTIEREFKHK